MAIVMESGIHGHGGAARRQAGLRLTRRGRIVLIGMPLFLSVLGVGVAGAGLASAAAATAPRADIRVTVAPGQSLWSIAERVAPNDDPRDVIAAIEQANGLASSAVQAGVSLRIPGEYAPSGRITG